MLDSEISFRKLFIFITFMHERNIARTAERLRLNSVTVHRALHSLEDSLGFPLFSKKGRNLVPLKSAEELLPIVRQSMNIFESGLIMAREASGLEKTSLRLGALCSLIPEVVPSLLNKMKLRKPKLRIEVVSGSNYTLSAALMENDLDAALMGTPYSVSGKVIIESLFQDSIHFACPATSRWAGCGAIDLESTQDEQFITLSDGFSLTMMQEELFRLAGFTPIITATVSDIFSMVQFVSLGMGYTLLPARMRSVCHKYGVALIPLTKKYIIQQDISLIYKARSEKDKNILGIAAECRMYRKSLSS